MNTFREIWARHGVKPHGLLHVGAGALEEADTYADMGLNPVIWVEALPKSDLRYDRAHQYGQLLYEGLVLYDTNGETILRVASNEASSSILPFYRHLVLYPDIVIAQELVVQTRRADDFFKDKFPPGIDMLVTDCQGADLAVIKGMGRLLDQIQSVWAEVMLTELYQGQPLKGEMENWLMGQGFNHSHFNEVHLGEWGEELFWR